MEAKLEPKKHRQQSRRSKNMETSQQWSVLQKEEDLYLEELEDVGRCKLNHAEPR